MKKRIILLALALSVALTGCEVMLERSYSASSPHVDKLTTAGDPSVVRVETYRELVSALLYLVSRGEEEGAIQFYSYTGDVEADLTAACLEVTTQDPLGAYAVDYIRHELSQVVAYDQANLSIHYRRTLEQIRSLVNVTGTSAIRTEIQTALSNFEEELVLRVAYFSEDEAFLRELIRQAYYDTPVTAMGMPKVEIALYPDSGRQRVVEILLTYPGDRYELRSNAGDLSQLVEGIAETYWDLPPEQIPEKAAQALLDRVRYDPEGPVSAYGALTEGWANSEGMALCYDLLCGRAFVTRDWDCDVVEGTYQGEGRFFNAIRSPNAGEPVLYADATRFGAEGLQLYTGQEMLGMGYLWPGAPVNEEEPQAEGEQESEETAAAEIQPE